MCIRLMVTDTVGSDNIKGDEPSHFQAQHEEVDILVAFHAGKFPRGPILVRSNDTDVLVIRIDLNGRSDGKSQIKDYGTGNYCHYISVSFIAHLLEEKD